MITKLYKNINDSIHYHEAWDNGNKVIVHWGKLGTIGEDEIIAIKHNETAQGVIERELSEAISNGFQEIDIDDHKTLVIQYKTETWGNEKDLEKRYAVEDIANECLGWTGNGICDGGQIGSGSIEIFSYVIDPQIACISLIAELEKKGFLDGAIIAFENEDEDYIVLHPEDFHNPFSFF